MGRSTLDDFGEEITGIAAPVSLCMAITVFLVRVLNPSGATDSQSVYIASIAYEEKAGDSSGAKFGGALLNALIFVCVVAAMTFVLFLLFKYGCIKIIYAYMGFAVFNIFFFITGSIIIQLLTVARIHIDIFSLCFILFNFSIVGMLGLFFIPIPLFMKQGYLVWVGVMVAYIFTFIPEWTAWILLVAMALYDLAAVLCPGGPLKILVELAIERQQELPALVYEARPTRGPYQPGMWARRGSAEDAPGAGGARGGPVAEGTEGAAGGSDSAAMVRPVVLEMRRYLGPLGEATEAPGAEVAAAGSSASPPPQQLDLLTGHVPLATQHSTDSPESGGSASPLMGSQQLPPGPPHPLQVATASSGQLGQPTQPRRSAVSDPLAIEDFETGHAGMERNVSDRSYASDLQPAPPSPSSERGYQQETEVDLPDAIKLGLGDFIFYSMLVGRAAMYDMMTVFSSYLAIMAGLGLTLLLLAVSKKALPALPFSIALGVAFYFLTRLALEPFLVPLSARNLYF